MKNKILVEIIVPKIDERYNLFIPVNKRVGKVVLLINKAIFEMSSGRYQISDTVSLYNRETGIKYDPNSMIYETDIRNGAILVLD